jgi:magnesium-transporting ATPase (P-type)
MLNEISVLTTLKKALTNETDSPFLSYKKFMEMMILAQPVVNQITYFIPTLMGSYNLYPGYTSGFLDCRAIKRELIVLEDHLCFEEMYWIWIIVILMAVTFVFWFFLVIFLFIAIF